MVHKKCKKWRSNYKQHFFRSFSTSQRSKNQTRMWRADELVTELSSKLMTAHFSPASVFVFIRAINSEQMHSQFLGAQDSRSLNALFVFLLSLPYLFTQNSGTPLQVHFFIPSILTHDERREKFSLGIDGGEKWAASGESAVGFFWICWHAASFPIPSARWLSSPVRNYFFLSRFWIFSEQKSPSSGFCWSGENLKEKCERVKK